MGFQAMDPIPVQSDARRAVGLIRFQGAAVHPRDSQAPHALLALFEPHVGRTHMENVSLVRESGAPRTREPKRKGRPWAKQAWLFKRTTGPRAAFATRVGVSHLSSFL